jgi:hypothetical protein
MGAWPRAGVRISEPRDKTIASMQQPDIMIVVTKK